MFRAVDWGIGIDGAEPGLHHAYMIVEIRPAAGSQAEVPEIQTAEISGPLVWNETVVDLCTVRDRRDYDPRLDDYEHQWKDFMWIGDIFTTNEVCSDWTDSGTMRNAFNEFGLAEQACIAFISDGLTHELCEPLNELPTTYEWSP